MHTPPAPSYNPCDELTAIAVRLKGYMGDLAAHAQGCLIPEPQDETHPSLPNRLTQTMEHQARERLITHVRRMEYILRCFILWLATQLMDRAREDSLFHQRLMNAFPKRPPQPYLPEAAPPPDAPHRLPNLDRPLIRRQQAELEALLSGKVQISAFSVTTPLFETRNKRRRRRHKARKFRPDAIAPVDARALLARLARLPRLLKRADQMAERIAHKALKAEQAEISPRPLLYFEPLRNWLPPEALWHSAQDAERKDLNALHLKAYTALSKLDVFSEAPVRDLPGFRLFRPPDPPQIRSV